MALFGVSKEEYEELYAKYQRATNESAQMRRTWLSPEDQKKWQLQIENYQRSAQIAQRQISDLESKLEAAERRVNGFQEAVIRWKKKSKAFEKKLEVLFGYLRKMAVQKKQDQVLAELERIKAGDESASMILSETVSEGKHKISVLLPLPPDMPWKEVWRFAKEELVLLQIPEKYKALRAHRRADGVWIADYERSWSSWE